MTKNDATRLTMLHQIFDEPLSNQQKDIAIMSALGIATECIADMNGITASGVRKHIEKIRLELNAPNVTTLRSIIMLRVIVGLSAEMRG